MNRVLALVEGQTERAFVHDVLAPALGYQQVAIVARVIGKPGHKGGVGRFQRALREILLLLRQEPGSYCTTMFDYYGMPNDWPGVSEAKGQRHTLIPGIIEPAIADAVIDAMGSSFNPTRFIPYIQMHEFEALLYSNPAVLAAALGEASLARQLQLILEESGGCEAIDDGPATAPSKRIGALSSRYQKTVHGLIAAQRMGLDAMRAACPHFGAWVSLLESLGRPAA